MYCANCGQELKQSRYRCVACHHVSLHFWLTVFTVGAWLSIVVVTFILFACVVPLLGSIAVGAPVAFPQMFGWNLAFSNFLLRYAVLIILCATVIVWVMSKWFGGAGRFELGFSKLSAFIFVLVTVFIAADSLYLTVFQARIMDGVEQVSEEESRQTAKLQALNAIRSVVVAEYRFRDSHPKVGFTCDFDALRPLGGPAKNTDYTPQRAAQSFNSIAVDVSTLTLRACQGVPVSSYEVSAVTNPDYGGLYEKAPAYCSDGSGALFIAKDGKAETCLTSRSIVP